jgi:hypothetical protein
MVWKPCNYNGACANGFLVLADDLDMIVVKSSCTSGNISFGGGGGVDFVTSASKSFRHLNCTICAFMTWMQVVDLRVGVYNWS